MDTSESALGKRTRTIGEPMETGTAAAGNTEERQGSKAFGIALAVDLEVETDHAQCWNHGLNQQVDAEQSSNKEGVDGAVSVWVADGRNRVLGQELSPEGEEQYAGLVQAAKIKELDAWETFDVFEPQRW